MGRVEAHARDLLLARWERLGELLAAGAPVPLLAAEAELIGKAGAVLDPEGYARRYAEGLVMQTRLDLGLCLHPDCDATVGPPAIEREGEVMCIDHIRESGGDIDVVVGDSDTEHS